ncbi:MAG: M20 family metallopeptidase [Candidatus Poribacteria bacterium]
MDVIELTKDLISYNSTSAISNIEIADFLTEQLTALHFEIERIEYEDENNVRKVNLVAKKGKVCPDCIGINSAIPRIGRGDGIALLGHTDAVPAEGWDFDPFSAFIEGGKLYGRGSSDMKGAIACMLCAVEQFRDAEFIHPCYLFFTSDEEIGCGGAKAIARTSQMFHQSHPRYGVIGEPTSLRVINSHKGAVLFIATAKGKAAHSSTGRGVNANLKMIPFLSEMRNIYEMLTTNEEYFNRAFDPPFSDWNIGVNDGNTPPNVTAPLSRCTINFRPMPGHDTDAFITKVQEVAKQHDIEVEVRRYGEPLLTPIDSQIVQTALELTGEKETGTVPYGTDALALGSQMELILIGPGDITQSHTVGEWVEIDQLYKAIDIYGKFIKKFCIETL